LSKKNTKDSKSPWWATLPVSQRVMLLKKVASMLSSVSDLQRYLHQEMTSNPGSDPLKLSSYAKQTVDLLSLSIGRAVRNYVVHLEVDIGTLARKKARSRPRSQTKTTRKVTRT